MALVSAEAKARKAEYMKAWREANREKLRKYSRTWLQQNKDSEQAKAAERNARYYQKRKDQILARKRDRYAALDPLKRLAYCGYLTADPELWRARQRKWVKANPEKAAAAVVRRRETILRATPAWANLDAIRAIYAEAKRLQEMDGVPRDVDHIVPLRGRNVCGLHVETNLQILTARENRKKGARHAA